MNNTHIENVGILRKMRQELAAVTSLHEVVERIGNLDVAESAAQARIAKLREEELEVRRAIDAGAVLLESQNAPIAAAREELAKYQEQAAIARSDAQAAASELTRVRQEIAAAQTQLQTLRSAIEQFTGTVREVGAAPNPERRG